jgi:prophage regulatory protein
MDIDRIVRFPECIRLTGLSERSIYRKMANGTFPSHRQLGPNCVGWRLSDIRAWIANPR